MLEHCVLKSRSQDIKYEGYYENMVACLEEALEQGINLQNLKLAGKNLSYANLDGADFTGSDFSGCNLTGTNMSESVLNKCLFSNASMIDVCMCESEINESIFHETSFSATDIAGASFHKSLFSCPSAFSMKWIEAANVKECVYFHEGQYCHMNGAPYVLLGLPSLLVIMDSDIMIGQSIKSFREWQSLSAFCCTPSTSDRGDQALNICAEDRELAIFRCYKDIVGKLYEQRNADASKAKDAAKTIEFNMAQHQKYLSEEMH